MKTELYKLTEENFETLFSYYEIIKEKSKKYYSYLSQFNKITNTYYSNIKNIFFNKNNINIDNQTILPKSSKLNSENDTLNNINIDITLTNKIISKKIDISPIENIIDKINEIIENYINCIQLFNKSIENQIASLAQNIEQSQIKINEIKNNYSLEKQIFIQKYSEFEILNKKLNMKYAEQEKNIIQFIIKSKTSNIKDNDENNINIKILDAKQNEIDIEKQFKKLGNFVNRFNTFYEKGINDIKGIISSFYNNFDTQINNIIILYKKSFILNINQLNIDKENIENEYNININKNIKNIDIKLSQINFDEYKIKILDIYKLNENDIDDNSKMIFNLIKNNKTKFNDKDIYYIVKKMYNFNHINKKQYVLDIQKEILILNEKIDKLFLYAKNQNKNNKDKINIWNIFYGISEDNKDKNDNDEDNDDNDDIFEEDVIVKNEPSKEDIDYICKLMNKKEFSIHLLTRLNNFRAIGSLNMPEKIFNYFVKIFIEISKYLTENEDNKIKDYNIVRMIFILSQTFYCIKNSQKIYLQNELNNVKIFHSVNFWKELLLYNMNEEIEKIEKKANKKFNRNEYIEHANKICFMQLLPYINGMSGFGMDKEKIKEVAIFIIKEFEINEKDKNLILDSIDNPLE